MKRVKLLTECTYYNDNRNAEEHIKSVANNTGNNAYLHALTRTFGAEYLSYSELDNDLREGETDIYIVGNFSWIRSHDDLPNYSLEAFEKIRKHGKKFVPISVGIHTFYDDDSFKIPQKTLAVLKDIAKQCVIGCRGEFTKKILGKHGITNTMVIGCPSFFTINNPDFKIIKKEKNIRNIATGITAWPNEKFSYDDIRKYLHYIIKHDVDFVEQTNYDWVQAFSKKYPVTKNQLESYVSKYAKIFYDFVEWNNYAKQLDFSFGGRFHGNVIPLFNNVPSLFITIDERTREMCRYFELPYIDIADFDYSKTPQEYYDELDYSKFNARYKEVCRRYEEFCIKNELTIIDDYEALMNKRLSEKLEELNNANRALGWTTIRVKRASKDVQSIISLLR